MKIPLQLIQLQLPTQVSCLWSHHPAGTQNNMSDYTEHVFVIIIAALQVQESVVSAFYFSQVNCPIKNNENRGNGTLKHIAVFLTPLLGMGRYKNFM